MARLVGFAGGALVLGPVEGPAPDDDTTPDAFSFNAQTGVPLSSVRTSNTITVTGIDTTTPISVAGGEYSISGGAFTSAPGTLDNNDTVTLRHTSSGLAETQTTTSVNIGGVVGIFSSTTAGEEPVFVGPNLSDMILIETLPMRDIDFSGYFSAAGDIAFSIDGELPDGLSMTSAGVLTGTPLETGTFAGLTVVAHNAGGDAPSNEFSISVPSRTPRSRRVS